MGGPVQTTQDNELPQWYQEAAIDRVNLGKMLGQVGYMPWMGPDVAALAPQQVAGMEGTNSLAAAFGMPSAGPVSSGLPAPQDFGGVSGYSSFPMFDQSINNLASVFPSQADFYSSFFIDPYSGEPKIPVSNTKNRNRKYRDEED